MSTALRSAALALAGSAALFLTGCWTAAPTPEEQAPEKPPEGTKEVREGQFRPRWQVGDSWVVETSSRPVQARTDENNEADPVKVEWKFTVAKVEKVGAHDCFRVEVVALPDADVQPRTVLWVDQKALALRRLQTQERVPGGFSSSTESYDFGDGQPAPVCGSLTVLPIDLPMFVAGKSGGKQTFNYTFAAGGAKRAPSDVGFEVGIEQSIAAVKPDKVKGLLPPDFRRDLATKPVVEVHLKTSERNVRQIWQPGQPWPVYSNNGQTVSRLVKFTPAQPKK